MYLPQLTNRELVDYAESQLDDLTSTATERELIKRMDRLVLAEDFATVAEDYEIENPEKLRAALEKLDSIEQIINPTGA